MATIKRFEDIEAWQTARELAHHVYHISTKGAFSKDFALRDQMRRAAVSVMSNIAEGFESRTPGLFAEYLGRAKGSAGELRAQAYVAQDAGYLTPEQFELMKARCERCSGQISKFLSYLKTLKPSNLSMFQRGFNA